MTDRVKGMDGEAPACQPPTTAPSPHRVSVDVAECADAGCARATGTAGWCKWARAVVAWRGGSAPLKRTALRQCLAQGAGVIVIRYPSSEAAIEEVPNQKLGLRSTVL